MNCSFPFIGWLGEWWNCSGGSSKGSYWRGWSSRGTNGYFDFNKFDVVLVFSSSFSIELVRYCYKPFWLFYSHLIYWRSWSWYDFYVSIVALSVCLVLPCLSWTAFGKAIIFCFLFVYVCLVSCDCCFRCLNFNTDKTLIAVAIIICLFTDFFKIQYLASLS